MCFTSFGAAEDGCIVDINDGDHVIGDGPTTCDNQEGDTDDEWTPGSYVDYNSTTGKYEVDQGFLDTLLAHPDQLLHDGARLEWDTNHFYFVGIASGDLAQELGFQNGDKLYAVSGNSVSTMSEAFDAFDIVYGAYSTGTIYFNVTVIRSATPVTLQYKVVE